jgi:hypothetical protein
LGSRQEATEGRGEDYVKLSTDDHAALFIVANGPFKFNFKGAFCFVIYFFLYLYFQNHIFRKLQINTPRSIIQTYIALLDLVRNTIEDIGNLGLCLFSSLLNSIFSRPIEKAPLIFIEK